MEFNKVFTDFIGTLKPDDIASDRKQILQHLAQAIQEGLQKKEGVALQFICTHNSRRSQFAQVWAQHLLYWHGYFKVGCYSGGTAVTAVYPEVINQFKLQGFTASRLSEGSNSVYAVKASKQLAPSFVFSKPITHLVNPSDDFIAVMTCDQAYEACPVVLGAKKRIGLTYTDPKNHDGQENEEQAYAQTSTQIATEMLYLCSQLNP